MNAWLVDVKTISNFQLDIFWTFDDINQISICSFYKMKVLYLNDTQMEKKFGNSITLKPAFVQNMEGFLGFFSLICFINITIGAFKNQSYLLTRCQLLLAVTPDSRLKYQSSEQLGQTLHQILTPNPDQVTMSYLEIYNENIRDLLDPASGYLELRDESGGRNIQVIILTPKKFKIWKNVEIFYIT